MENIEKEKKKNYKSKISPSFWLKLTWRDEDRKTWRRTTEDWTVGQRDKKTVTGKTSGLQPFWAWFVKKGFVAHLSVQNRPKWRKRGCFAHFLPHFKIQGNTLKNSTEHLCVAEHRLRTTGLDGWTNGQTLDGHASETSSRTKLQLWTGNDVAVVVVAVVAAGVTREFFC
jgi:hypothetical protein